MSFEEDLKCPNCKNDSLGKVNIIIGGKSGHNTFYYKCYDCSFVKDGHLEQVYIERQKVKEAIEDCIHENDKDDDDYIRGYRQAARDLRKILGLEEEQ